MSLIVVVIGAGVMALPALPKKSGVFAAVGLALLCHATICESGIAMWKGIMANNHKASKGGKSEQITSYEDFGRAAFGANGEAAVGAMMVVFFIGLCSVFATLIAESLVTLDGLAHPEGAWWGIRGWLCAIYPVFGCLVLLPNVTAVARLVPFAVVAIITLCLLIIGKSTMDSQRWQGWPDLPQEHNLHKMWWSSAADLGVVVASMFGAFGVNANIPMMLCEMKEPLHFPFAYRTAMLVVGAIYMTVMLVGYYAYGEFMQGDYVRSLTSYPASYVEATTVPFEDWTGPKAKGLALIMSSLLLVKLFVSFTINMMVIFSSFQTFKLTKDIFPVGSVANKIMRLTITGMCIAVAQVVPDFGMLFGLVCALTGPLLQSILPLVMGYWIRKQMGSGVSSWPRRAFHCVMMALSFYTLFLGTTTSISDILKSKF